MPERHSFVASAWRFLVAGGLNTLVTALLLTALSLVMDARIAYTIVFAAGVVVSTVLADRFVYGVRMNHAAILAYVLLYVAVYFVGLLAIHAWTSSGGTPHASGLVVIITAPLTFLGGRLITGQLSRRRARTNPEPTPTETL